MNSILLHDDDPLTGNSRLQLTGRIGIGDAGEFRNAALAVLDRNRDVTIDCEAVGSFDVSAIQLMLALGREQSIRGKRFDITGVSESLARRFSLAGLSG